MIFRHAYRARPRRVRSFRAIRCRHVRPLGRRPRGAGGEVTVWRYGVAVPLGGSEVDPTQLSTAGWLVEALADEAQGRLKEEVERQASGKAAGSWRRF